MYQDDQPQVGLSAERTERFVLEHGNAVLRVARSYCASAADAEDVYQRTLELVMTKAPGIDGEDLVAWACKVAHNEALMLTRGPRGAAKDDFDDIAERFESELPTPEETLLDDELLGQGRELLSRLRPDQTRCLLLRADDMSYPEICEQTGFSYAKVNRLLSEGRKALKLRHEMLVSGSECRRLEDSLSQFADGVAGPTLTAEVEAHLDHCMGCRATVRDYREAPRRLAGYLPLGVLASLGSERGFFGRIADQTQAVYAQVQERLFGSAASGQQAAEMAAAKKVVAAVLIGGSLVAGGAAVEKNRADDPKPSSATAGAVETPRQLIDPINVPDVGSRTRAEREGARARSARDEDTLGNDDARGLEAPEPQDQTVPADQAQRAADPADQAPEGAENEVAPVNDGIGP